MSKEIVYSIGQIFDAHQPTGTLTRHGAKHYYIAPYQRGYKWASNLSDDPVQLLMQDLAEAAEAEAPVYYLQFITVKETKVRNAPVLEVIDGQQRLTTLTLLLSLLQHRLSPEQPALSENKLMYEVRQTVTDFFRDFIYHNNIFKLLDIQWAAFIEAHPEYDEQDIYYLFNAVKAIDGALKDQIGENKKGLAHYEKYLKERVKIIVNKVEPYTNCEEIFSNLNDNKVQLTSAELVKALLLTQYARGAAHNGRKLSYRAILEIRALQGRQWDEMAQWVNNEDIKTYFRFNKIAQERSEALSSTSMDQFINLFCQWKGLKTTLSNTRAPEFNFLHGLIKNGKSNPGDLFVQLKRLRSVLNNWYDNYAIYNWLGFILHAEYVQERDRKSIANYLSLFELSLKEVRNNLTLEVLELLPDADNVPSLEYGTDNKRIHNILLALSVLREDVKFDFTQYASEHNIWTLEHIFPQSAETIPEVLQIKDVELIRSVLGEIEESVLISWAWDKGIPEPESFARAFYFKINNNPTREINLNKEEKDLLSDLMKTGLMNRIGNMALLRHRDNSSNRDGMFNKKRQNIVKRISEGSFVPKHTYDVFAKLLHPEMVADLSVWTKADILAHEKFIIEKVKSIKRTT